jgi:hypothetical protein
MRDTRFWILSIIGAIFIIAGIGLCVDSVAKALWAAAFWAGVTAVAGMGMVANELSRKKPTA